MITLEEIENVTFRKAGFSGYKVEDVDDFVDKVIDKVKSLELANKELESRLDSRDKEIQAYKEKEDSVQSALVTAQITAKTIITEAEKQASEQTKQANEAAEQTVTAAQAKADKLVADAQAKADQLNSETDAKVEELMNKALRESSAKIEENNEILEAQKRNIIKLMGEANKFRNSLLQTYKNHLNVINSMAKADDFKKQQKELDERYPKSEGNKPITISRPEAKVIAEKTAEEQDKAETVTEPIKEEKAAEQKVKEEKVAEIQEVVKNSRQPVVIGSAEKTEPKIIVAKFDEIKSSNK